MRILLLLIFALCGGAGCAKQYRYAPMPLPPAAPHARSTPSADQTSLARKLPPPEVMQKPEAGSLSSLAVEAQERLESMGYTVQVGAFASLDNAVRMERLLAGRGIDAYYFRHESGLYKVRFGNHPTFAKARQDAERLLKQGFIDKYYIVRPEEYAASRKENHERQELRTELVLTARRFLGVPYRWGGADQDDGFDCSGLTMVAYRLNGLNLPRDSRTQFRAGQSVSREDLRPGDLVFFATRGPGRVSHVGMYIGENRFIHAPRTGQDVRVDVLSDPFYLRTFLGGRSYL